MRNWRGKRFSQKRSRVLPAIFRGKSFAIRANWRTWFIQNFALRPTCQQRAGAAQDAQDNIVMSYRPLELYRPRQDMGFGDVRLAYYDAAGNITKEEFRPTLTNEHWSETPFD